MDASEYKTPSLLHVVLKNAWRGTGRSSIMLVGTSNKVTEVTE